MTYNHAADSEWQLIHDDFIAIRTAHSLDEAKEIALKAFDTVDSNHAGAIDAVRLKQVYIKMAEYFSCKAGTRDYFSSQKVWEIFHRYDDDKNSLLTRDEFISKFMTMFI